MDTKPKHTPGPWKIGPEATDLMNPDCANGRFHSIDAKDHGALAVVVTQMEDDFGADNSERLMANARLIAAAPEMRALLRVICDSTSETEEYAAIVQAEILLARVDDTGSAS